jgi:hypothetical protein
MFLAIIDYISNYLETCKPFICFALIIYPYIGGWGLFSKKKTKNHDERIVCFNFKIEYTSDETFSLESDLIKVSISYNSDILLSIDQLEMIYYLESDIFSLNNLSVRFEPYLEKLVDSLKNDNLYDSVKFYYESNTLNDLFKEKCQVDFCEFIEDK